MKRNAGLGLVLIACVAFVAGMSTANAQFILDDLNSTVIGDENPGPPLMRGWAVDNVSQLFELDDYYRRGPNAPEMQLKTIAPLVGPANVVDTNPFTDPRADVAVMKYLLPQVIEVELKMSLMGAPLVPEMDPPNISDVTHQLRITNLGYEPLDFHLFQYADFDLGGTVNDLYAAVLPPDKVEQVDAGWKLTEVVTPDADHWEVAYYPTIKGLMTDALPTTLADIAGPVGPGDVEYGLQWDFVIEPGETFILSKDMLITPEPSTVMLGLVGLLGLGLARRRRV